MSAQVLLVEPDATERQRLDALISAEGHRVHPVADAHEATHAKGAFDVVVSAIDLPGSDGFWLLARLREANPDQEVVFIGARTESRDQAARAGVAECLVRPVEAGELKLAVQRSSQRALLRREKSRLLDENREFVRTQNITQRCLELIGSPDLEWLQERGLSDLAAVSDAQSGALWVLDDRAELALRSYRGLVDRRLLNERIDPNGVLAPRLRDGTPWTQGEGRARMLFAPLVASGEVVGLAQLSDPLVGDFTAEHLRGARMLADFLAVGVRNGRKFLALQRLGLRDRETAAYNLSYFTDYAAKEIYKARRYGRTFSLLTCAIDNLPQVKLRLGAPDAQKAQRAIIRAISRIVRDSDVLAKATEQEFYLLLPETDYFGALMFLRRAVSAVGDDPEVQEIESRLPLAVVAGASTFPKDGDDFDELVHRCRRRMDERRASLHRKLMLDAIGFWDEVDLLLGSAASPKLPLDERSEPSRRGKVSDLLFEEVQGEIARELLRDPAARGVLYVGGPDVRISSPVVQRLEQVPPEFAARVYLLGRRADLESHPALTPVFLEGDERLSRHEFVLWLSEQSAYALLQRRGLGATWGFHTSDTTVVDGLIAKLQAEYDLQPY